MLPTITAQWRPAPPKTWAHQNAPVSLAWHHIIPFHELRDTWNVLVGHCHNTQSREAPVALRRFLLLCDRGIGSVDSWVAKIRTGDLNVPESNMLIEKVVWPPWNIVEGPNPRARSDDPGDNAMDRFTHGLTSDELARMNEIERVHRDLASFGRESMRTSPGALIKLSNAINTARPTFNCSNPIPFHKDMWEEDSNGLWKKRRSGERVIVK